MRRRTRLILRALVVFVIVTAGVLFIASIIYEEIEAAKTSSHRTRSTSTPRSK